MHTTWRNSEDRTRSPTPNFTTFLLRYQPTFQLCEKSLSALTQSLLATLPSLGPWLEPPMLGGQSCEGLGILRDQDEWKVNLAPDAPSLIADQFHPHVWAAASAIWDTGNYRVAVQQAAVALSAHIAKKVGSPLSERKLVAQVFLT